MATNPFDLSGKQSSGRNGKGPTTRAEIAAFPTREWTPEEQAAKLSGYLEVPQEHWEGIRYGTHVRYFTKANGFRAGGFVVKNPFTYRPKGATEDRRGMRLQNTYSRVKGKTASWFVDFAGLERLYIKPDSSVLVMIGSMEAAVRGLNDNIRKLVEHQKKLEARLAALEGSR